MFDFSRSVKRLEAVGVNREQAEAYVQVLCEIYEQYFVVRGPLSKIEELRLEMNSRFNRVETHLQVIFARLK